MTHKKTHVGKVTGHGTGGTHPTENRHVNLHGVITEGADAGRPITLTMSPEEAYKWAAGLVTMAGLAKNGPKQTREEVANRFGLDATKLPAPCVVDGCKDHAGPGESMCPDHKRELAQHPERFA